MKDGTTHLVEATSDPANAYKQKLLVKDLKGVLGSMLPSGFEIIIYGPHGRTPGLDFLSFQNLSKGRCIDLSVKIYFQDWSHRTNLLHFAEGLRMLVEHGLPHCQLASVTKDEYGVSLWISIFVGDADDCYELFTATDQALFTLYKKALTKADATFVSKLEAASASSESGLRWWVRYVVVPLVSGGAGAALIGWFVLHLQ
jgi:hypothetical protein